MMQLKSHVKMPVYSTSSQDRASSDLAGFLAILGRNAHSIALLTLLSLGLALAYLTLASPTYTAATSLFIDPRSRKILPEEIVQGNLGSDLVLVESQLAIIGSDTVLKRVVEKMNLVNDPEFNPPVTAGSGLLSSLKALIRGPARIVEPETRALTSLSEALKVKRAQKTYVVDVEVSSSSPVKAARLSEAVVEAYLADQSSNKADEARRANKMIDARLDELRAKLREAETRVDEFKKANKIVTSEGGLVTEQQLTRLSGELVTARAVAAESQARVDFVTSALKEGGSPEALPDVIRSGLVQKLREQYAQVARREAALATQLQGRHPVLIEARSQLQEIKAQIAAELKRISTSAKSENQIALNRVAELSTSLERAKEEVSRTNSAQIRLRELDQEVVASRDLLNTFLLRAKQTQEQQNLNLAEARVISPASIPAKPSKPLTWLILALGLLGGLGLGIARALVKDHIDRPVDSRPPPIPQATGGSERLAAIPALGANLLNRLFKTGTDAASYSELMSAILEPTSKPDRTAFRQAVLRLLSRLRANSSSPAPSIAFVAAPNRGAGASSVALSLAYAAAHAGERVLLVDATSADTDLSNTFAADFEHHGLVVLDNKAHLQAITRRDARSGLVFLPIALADLRALRPHQRKRLASGITDLAQSYDWVVIDGGALLEDESSQSLLAIADQIVVVARAGTTSAHALTQVERMLEPLQDRFAGTVLNMAATRLAG